MIYKGKENVIRPLADYEGRGMTIAEASKECGLTADTLRYYERIGLLPTVERKSGIRNYTEEDLKWISFIKCLRSAGLSIEVLIEYVTMFQQGDATIVARKNLLVEQRKHLVEKIEELNHTLSYLDKKIANYEDTMLKYESGLKKFDE